MRASRAWIRGSRAAVLGVAVSVLSWSTGQLSSLIAGLGAGAAALLAERLARTVSGSAVLRIGAVWACVAAVSVAGVSLARAAANAGWLASALGPVGAIVASETLLWLAATAPLIFALRLTALRHPAAGAAEVVLVASCFVGALTAHRHGLVNRPFALGDWSWQVGIDPTLILLALGAAATFLLVLLLVAEEDAGRLGVPVAALAIVALTLTALVRLDALPRPDPPGTGEAREQSRPSGGSRGEGEQDERQRRKRPDDWDFRDESNVEPSEAPVAVVVLHDDYEPNSGAYYFRQSALSQFNGRRLVRATRDDVDRDVIDFFPGKRHALLEAPEPGADRKPLRTTTGLLVDHVNPFGLDSPVYFEPSEAGTGRFQRTYSTLSLVQTRPYAEMLGGHLRPEEWGADQWEHYTRAPEDPRYRELAEEIRETLPEGLRDDPLALAVAVKIYLDENGLYSLANRHADSEDPTASFLFGDLTGYCVHFAHAASFLLRSQGFPARVATGYAVPARERYGGSAIVIRSLNAHAWPEVWLPDLGWIVVDPVPERSEAGTAPPVDPELQRMLGELLRETADELAAAERTAPGRRWLAALARLALVALLVAALGGYAVRFLRRLAPAFARPAQCPRVAYRAALDRLSGVGLTRRYGESREHFARRLGQLAPSLGPLTAAHLRAALSEGEPGDPEPLRHLSARVGFELRDATPHWRRLLAALDPFCWMRVH